MCVYLFQLIKILRVSLPYSVAYSRLYIRRLLPFIFSCSQIVLIYFLCLSAIAIIKAICLYFQYNKYPFLH